MATNIQRNAMKSEKSVGQMAENLSSHHSNDDESVISDMHLDKTNTRATEHKHI